MSKILYKKLFNDQIQHRILNNNDKKKQKVKNNNPNLL